jgi:hypothetical protein
MAVGRRLDHLISARRVRDLIFWSTSVDTPNEVRINDPGEQRSMTDARMRGPAKYLFSMRRVRELMFWSTSVDTPDEVRINYPASRGP